MKEKVLITGASGFLGYHLIHAALKKGLEVYAGVRESSKVGHLKDLPLSFSRLNLSDKASLVRDISDKRYDYIVHAAGITKAGKLQEYNRVNSEFSVNLATAAIDAGIPLKRFIFISSLAAVGPLQNTDELITENTPLNPVTDYGRSKKSAETALSKLSLPLTILRPTAIYGPRETDIFIFFESVKRGLEPYIGRQEQQLSFIFARDMAEVTLNALEKNVDGVYNISDGSIYSRYAIADNLKSLMHKKTLRIHVPYNLVKVLALLLEKASGVLHKHTILNRDKLHELTAINWACDISRARNDLDFAPEFPLKKGLDETLKWYRDNDWL